MREVVIIGSGPAAHTAAVYCARAELKPLLFEGWMAGGVAAGGQLTTTTTIENFPGFPDGISGLELMEKMRQQSLNSGVEIITETVDKVELGRRPIVSITGSRQVESAALIIASGATARRAGVEGEQTYWQKGISACAVCDGGLPVFRNKPLAVVGGGDTAVEEALFLSRFASKVYLIHRRDSLRAGKSMQKRLFANDKIEVVWNSVVESAAGSTLLEEITLVDTVSSAGQKNTLAVNGMFYAMGHTPNTDFLQGQLELDEKKYIVTRPGTGITSVEGVFAAGDVQDPHYRQAITAAGSGCKAALEAERYLSRLSGE